jgi:lipopolysaccharide heptosyltransferase I
MTARSRPALRDYSARRVALLKPSALGDVIQSLPVLTALRRRFPAARVTWVVNRAYADLLVAHPDLDDVLSFDRGASRGGPWAAAAAFVGLVRELRRRRFDLVVDLQGLFRSGFLAAASGAPRRVGLGAAREGAAWFYTDVVPVSDFHAYHAVDRYWLVAEALGVGDGPKVFRLPVADAHRPWARAALADRPRPWLALAVGSRWPTKRWPAEHFCALVRRAQARFGATAVFVGTPDEAALADAVAAGLAGPAVNLHGRTTLPQLASVLAEADATLANDTGPLHLAAALGRPVVAPYTCTSAKLNGPYGAARGAVETTVWCQGSYVRRCARLECMAELTPDRLWPRLYEVLLTWEMRRRSA